MRDPREASLIAVERRRARAAVKREIQSGVRTPLSVAREAWSDADSPAAGLRITEFLGSIAGIGVVKIRRILDDLEISPRKRLGALGARQTESLSSWLLDRQTHDSRANMRGRLVVVAGPTAVGKGTVVARIRERHPDVKFSVSATTRSVHLCRSASRAAAAHSCLLARAHALPLPRRCRGAWSRTSSAATRRPPLATARSPPTCVT